MSRVQLAFIPAMLIGILFFLGATQLISKPPSAEAARADTILQQNTGDAVTDPSNSAGALALLPQPAPTSAIVVPAQTGTEGGGLSAEIPVVEPVFVNVTAGDGNPQDTGGQNASPSLQGCSLRSGFDGSVLQWCELIEAYASANGLEPALVAALITQESGGDANAYSGSGAVGLMQVMPRDGLASSFMCAAGPCFTERPSSQELYDPEFNIAYGTRLLASLLQRHGNIRDALKSYGPLDVGYYYADLVLGIFNANR